MSTIVIFSSGQGESAFGLIGPWGNGLRYNTLDPSMPPQVDIYAAPWFIGTNDQPYIAPPQGLFAVLPSAGPAPDWPGAYVPPTTPGQVCCAPREQPPIEVQPVPEASTFVMLIIAFIIAAGVRLVRSRIV